MDISKKNNFLISGFGRSGTMFLSSVMNLSNQWTVEHEPRSDEDEVRIQPTVSLLEAFSQDYYGEVNSRLRFHFYDVPVALRGLILREPEDIILSISNRKSITRTKELVHELNNWNQAFATWVSNDPELVVISFTGMTQNKEYLDGVLNTFGIKDVDVEKVNLTKKINPNMNITYKCWDDLPIEIIREYQNLNWL